MDKNSIIGAVLIALIIIVGLNVFSPSTEDTKKQEQQAVHQQIAANKVDSISAKDTSAKAMGKVDSLPGMFNTFLKGNNNITILENQDIRVGVANHGGKIAYVELKKYKTYQGKPVYLHDTQTTTFGFKFLFEGTEINTSDLYFTPTTSTDGVVMNLLLPNGQSISFNYALPKDGYTLKQSLTLNNFDKVINRRISYIDIDWKGNIRKNEQDVKISRDNTTIHYRPVEDEPDYLSESKSIDETIKTKTQWISFKEQFFAQTIIAETPFIRGNLKSNIPEDHTDTTIKNLEASLTLPFEHKPINQYNFKWYFGPLHYGTLAKEDLSLERQIPLGWSFFLIGWINRFLIIPIFGFLSMFISNYGLIIFILTLFIKAITWPFTYKSYLSMAKMRVLKPEVDALRKKYGEDMARMQQEQMKLNRQAGVSPLGGCLPLLLQFPILIAMFRFFPSSIELRQQSFLWATDLSTYDSIYNFGKVPDWVNSVYGDHVSLFTLLMTVSTILQTHFNSNMTSPDQQQFKWMGYVMPIFFLGLFNKYSAGLSLYYFLFNMVSFGQQLLFRRFVDEGKLRAQIEEHKKKPSAQKKSKWQQKLESIAKSQQDLQKARQQGQANKGKNLPPKKK